MLPDDCSYCKEKIVSPGHEADKTKSFCYPSHIAEDPVIVDVIAECRHGNQYGETKHRQIILLGREPFCQPG